ncbi:MAG: type IA DNA topoisomerase [Lachnospiraceae bacterium]|nr:type IA DNA topoisomerase [Lachnospiraceae bacterium]
MKNLYIAEKPSVAREFAKALKVKSGNHDGYMEDDTSIVTWCVGHLVTMSYPEAYDPALAKWSMETIPFIPDTFRYEVIGSASKQFEIVKKLLNREDVGCIYVCTDSGREGEYIYRLVDQMAQVDKNKEKRRVWIDSQTEEEILRGVREAKELSEYDNLCAAAYSRAKEDYLMGINFSRVLTLKYGNAVRNYLNEKRSGAISVGRVMTCVLGMVVQRERSIREFVKTPFYRIVATVEAGEDSFEAEWRAVEGSPYFESPKLYKENGFKKREDAEGLIAGLKEPKPWAMQVEKVEKKVEKKNPPMLYNLADLQNDCSRLFKISPDETLKIVQELYEKKLVTYPRTDARVLSTAVSKEIYKNISGLKGYEAVAGFAAHILEEGSYKTIAKTKYVNDKQITDHYAIIPTGQGLSALNSMSQTGKGVYDIIARRFLSVFYPAAEYQKASLILRRKEERFFASFKVLYKQGFLEVAGNAFTKKKGEEEEEEKFSPELIRYVASLKKGSEVEAKDFDIREGETKPPSRYTSGTLVIAMEKAGSDIEEEELRDYMKGSGIGTSATRAEIIKKLINIEYMALNKKTQVVTPTLKGEMIYDIVYYSINALLQPKLTASWEKGLGQVERGEITEEHYMKILEDFVVKKTELVKSLNNQNAFQPLFDKAAAYYKKGR